ncbi:1-phosphofructokinase family hexose kinase [Corynebacterium ulceribovis]|uniref:1-phosphofructokinase family hexose kinase n=1 Tax=Corynebacterium ulceribovis TaxID=487732 RepID=UPI0003700CD5|nr:1-phosphofructokinase family hexose kinase [Corynebacterium ulceribovis]
MILTLTANPSIDRTASIPNQLERGGVFRLSEPTDIAGGKGINVSEAIHLAGVDTLALFPANPQGHFVRLVRAANIPHEVVDVAANTRVNLTVVEEDGTTTKLNSAGIALTDAELNAVIARAVELSAAADWVVLAGSLPSGTPRDFYVRCIQAMRARRPELQIAVDTSDAPLTALATALRSNDPTLGRKIAPNVIKPNGFELGQFLGIDGDRLEDDAAAGDLSGVVAAARELNALGIDQVLVTLGATGALLVAAGHDPIFATPPQIIPRSTVGAGDCTLAGFLMSTTEKLSLSDGLARAVAYGASATSLPGTTIPTPSQVHPDQAIITIL